MIHSLYGGLGSDPLASAAAAAMLDPVLASKDTTFTKIFVGGLPYHTSDKTLREYFEQFGDIEEAVVITDRQTGKSRGYGFVTMKDRAGAERACKDPNPIIDGRKANVNLAYLGAKPRGNLQLTSGLGLPLQTAGAGFPSAALLNPATRLGLSQLYYPGASPFLQSGGLVLPQVSPLSPTAVAASAANQAAAAQYLDYTNASTAAALANYAAATGNNGQQQAATALTGNPYETYAYSPTYGMIPTTMAAAYAAYQNPGIANNAAAAAALAATQQAGAAGYQPGQESNGGRV